jgi:hypothetical protein
MPLDPAQMLGKMTAILNGPVTVETMSEPEKSRTYVFPGGEKVTINGVIQINTRPDGHAMLSADGRKHEVPSGWIHLVIRP